MHSLLRSELIEGVRLTETSGGAESCPTVTNLMMTIYITHTHAHSYAIYMCSVK